MFCGYQSPLLLTQVAVVAEMEALHDLSNKHFNSLRLTRVTATANAQTASNKDQHGVLNMTPFRMVISLLRCGGITLDCSPHGRGDVLFLPE